MTSPSFAVGTSPRFDRLMHALQRQHAEIADRYAQTMRILAFDPYNQTRRYNIKKLVSVQQGDGQYRLTLGRWRFRYDVFDREIVLQYCGLRRENTYRQ